jgi:predicted  nucleic acid-binding Zn-ribbon protein
LRQTPGGGELQDRLEALEALEIEVSNLRQELGETQERLDFAERLLAQAPEARRVGPQD